MKLESEIGRIAKEAETNLHAAPDNLSLRKRAKEELSEVLKELGHRRRCCKENLATISVAEERACKLIVRIWESAVKEVEAENPLPPISLGDLTPEALRALRGN